MALDFNSQGYLYQTIALTYEKFVTYFGTNPGRKQQIDNALFYFRIFYQCGCRKVYIDGSFVSTKKNPGDIDLCFDLTGVDIGNIKRVFPEFFDPNEIGRIRRQDQCHIFHFDNEDRFMLELFSADREGNPKGLVKLILNNIIHHYDKK
jgi:hypothetical protein